MNILRRIQYSKIGRVIFKKGPLLEAARWSRRQVYKVIDGVKDYMDNRVRLLEVIYTYFVDDEFVMPKTDEVIDIIVPIYNGYDYLVTLY